MDAADQAGRPEGGLTLSPVRARLQSMKKASVTVKPKCPKCRGVGWVQAAHDVTAIVRFACGSGADASKLLKAAEVSSTDVTRTFRALV